MYQSEADPKVFMLVERWQSQADVDRHRAARAFTEIYVPRVLPLVERTPHPSRLLNSPA